METVHQYPRHPQHAHHLSNGQDASSVSSSASSQALPPPSTLFGARPPSRHEQPPHPPHLLSSMVRSPGGSASNHYPHPYGSGSAPSGLGVQSPHDPMGSEGITSSALASSISAQKRAYRQRRKDPSCDACRERKVKCDATETSSCSECSSRSVKCQFTKETNRRMSSIKQVQDLQTQLQEARSQITNLQTRRPPGSSDLDPPHSGLAVLKLPDLRPPELKRGPMPLSNFDHVRHNIRTYSRGVFKPPPAFRVTPRPPPIAIPDIQPPPRQLTDQLLAQYYDHVHRHSPIVHWPSFMKEVDRIYAAGTFQGTSQTWVSVFFGTLACGTLQTSDRRRDGPGSPEVTGRPFFRLTLRLLNTGSDEITMDHARANFLLAVFCYERNLKSAGWVWLGAAVRSAQDVGLQSEIGPLTVMEAEMRRRVWWAIYAFDRLLSLELGRTPMIDDDDCDILWPCPVDDEFIQAQGIAQPPHGHPARSYLPAVIPMVRFISQLTKTLKAPVILPATLQTFSDYFQAVLSTLPPQFQKHVDSSLSVSSLSLIFRFETVRFHLFRHNLTTVCHPTERLDALERCHAVARDTAQYIVRTFPTTSGSSSPSTQRRQWEDEVAASASITVTLHVWRCILITCFRGDYTTALTLLRLSTAVGEQRRCNPGCGRYLFYFLDRLSERVQSGASSQQTLLNDEEMLAYVSGDMQGTLESSWIWAGSDTGTKLNPAIETSPQNYSNGDPVIDPQSGILTEQEAAEWGGWETVQGKIQALLDLQRARDQRDDREWYGQSSGSGGDGAPPPAKRLHLGPHAPETQSGRSEGNASRISIANITG